MSTPSTPLDPQTQRILERTRARREALDREEAEAKAKESTESKETAVAETKVTLERSESGGAKRKGAEEETVHTGVKRTPSNEAFVLRPQNEAQEAGLHSKAATANRFRSKMATISASVAAMEDELSHSSPPSSIASASVAHSTKSANPVHPPQASSQPNPVAERVRAVAQVRFSEVVLSKTISSCPSTTSTRPSLDDTLDTVSDARVADVSSSADSAQVPPAPATPNAGIETFFRPKPGAQAKALNRTPSGLETFVRRREEEEEESLADDSLDASAAAAVAEIDVIAREAGFNSASNIESSGEETQTRERSGSLSDRIAAFQKAANTSYRIPKPVRAEHEEPFYQAPPANAQATTRRPHEEWLVKGTARTARVEPTKEMGLGDDERKSKIAALRSRWEISTAAGNTLMPEQDDRSILRAAAKTPKTPTSLPSHTSTPDRVHLRHNGGGPWAPALHEQGPPQPAEAFDEPSSISFPEDGSERLVETTQEEAISELGETAISPDDDDGRDSSAEMDAALDDALEDDDDEEEEEAPKTPTPPRETGPHPTLDKTPLPLVHSVSFYRQAQKAARATPSAPRIVIRDVSETTNSTLADSQSSPEKPPKEKSQPVESAKEKSRRLEVEVRVKQEQIAQASHALNLCRSTPGFRGSREEVESQAILLIKTEERKALLMEMDRLAKAPTAPAADSTAPRGTLTLGKISFPLKREFINDNCNFASSSALHYFILLIKHRESVHETQMVNTDQALKSGRLEFQNYITLQGLQPDFRLKLELYSLRTTREQFSHDVKYGLDKKGTLKSRPKSGTYQTGSPAGPLAILDPSFQQVGSCELRLSSISKNKFVLDGVQFSSPVEGTMRAFLRVAAESTGEVEKRGWLNVYEEINGLGAWSRLYAVLRHGSIKFWKYQDEVKVKPPLNEVDLASCKNSSIRLCSRDLCTRPHSFSVDVLCQIDPEDPNKLEKFRIMLAIDSGPDAAHCAEKWIQALNQSLNSLRLWETKSSA